MTQEYSIQEVFREYLASGELLDSVRPVVQLIACGKLTRENFHNLIQVEGLSHSSNLKQVLLDLALIFARRCLADHRLSSSEMNELELLATTFGIVEGDFYEHRQEAVREVIRAQAMWVLEDARVTDQEEVLQRDLQRLFGLSYDQYVSFVQPIAKQHIDELERKVLSTKNSSELQSLNAAIQNLRAVFLIPR